MGYFCIRVIDVKKKWPKLQVQILGRVVVSIPACHAGGRGSIPRRGSITFYQCSRSWVHIQYVEGYTWLSLQVES